MSYLKGEKVRINSLITLQQRDAVFGGDQTQYNLHIGEIFECTDHSTPEEEDFLAVFCDKRKKRFWLPMEIVERTRESKNKATIKNILGFLVSYSRDKSYLLISKVNSTPMRSFSLSWNRDNDGSLQLRLNINEHLQLSMGQENLCETVIRDIVDCIIPYGGLKKLNYELSNFMQNETKKEFYYQGFQFPKVVTCAIFEFIKGNYFDFKETGNDTLEFSVKTIPDIHADVPVFE